MKNVCVRDLTEACEGRLLFGNEEEMICHASTDSREILKNSLFVPIVGARMDGHDYIDMAVKNGARVVLTAKEEVAEEYKESGVSFILVKDTTAAFQNIAKMARAHLSIPAVGVTGSVGKTTTREMISSALSSEKKVYKTDKNYNNWLGVPITLSEMTDEDDIAVLELGLNVRGELGLISSLTDLDVAVITNIGVAHMEYYGNQDELCKEKMTITRGFWEENPKKKLLILNGNDPYLRKYKDYSGFPYVFYGTEKDADYRAENVGIEDGSFAFDLIVREQFVTRVTLSVLGEHNVLNALAAFAVADHYGVDLKKAAASLSSFTGFKNRLQRFLHRDYLIIDDTYNASPDSMKAGLKVLSAVERKGEGRRIALLGDMFELGENSSAFHEEVGEFSASIDMDLLLLVGERAKMIKQGAKEAQAEFEICHFDTKEEVLPVLKQLLHAGDVLYIKASNGMKLKEITEGLLKDE